ncbi:MAG: hypothetical protein L0332_23890 [Chloroflexi bacterium]|nr:hypothetical protein [Chloroflexota bacterium]
MNSKEQIVITGLGVEIPGLGSMQHLLALPGPLPPAEFDPTPKLQQRGLRYKNRATQLALCAVHDALLDAGLPEAKVEEPETTGVVVSSNLGNVDTVCRMVQTIREGSVVDLSPMDLPNASSNVIATTIAIRFGCRATNLMLCNGATSGIDALWLAANIIRAGRAHRMIVVGVEPRNEFVARLMAESRVGERVREGAGNVTGEALCLADGAACLVLEAAEAAFSRGARVYGKVSSYRYFPPQADLVLSLQQVLDSCPFRPRFWLTPNQSCTEAHFLVDRMLATWEGYRPETLDLNLALGELYGALGVFQALVAALWLDQRQGADDTSDSSVWLTSGGTWGDGMACLVIS